MSENAYSIWVAEYAYVTNYPVSGVLSGAHNQGVRKLPYCYVVIKGGGRAMMVDVGYNDEAYGTVLGDRFGVEHWHSPRQVLAELGVTPEEVDTVFITHSHFDHLGNTDAFPNATFYIQERELSKWIWAMAQPEHMQWMMAGTDPSDILRAVELTRQGRLKCIDGPQEDVLPGIDLHVAYDSHTYGCMWVHVRNDLARQSQNGWVLAGDLVYVYDNLVNNPEVAQGRIEGKLSIKPVGLAMGSNTNLVTASDEMLKAVDYQVKRVIPIHEERLKDVFPSRITQNGLRVSELCLAGGQASAVL
ncbi:N-acyl homoserine lactonase family protein [Pseudomonas tolaasii]|uniref:N-acyl homoserine lactonase family protein n=1 Tax=Pseudomonas tolaasii TaxID=29442 RepID=UPI001C55DC15|nr:N-acyl homoserine lactonase family protein [Pseudomonas tolaasii]MBW1248745.1 N-acyl homoserine lactonase family protein [Pseudomonas tolaasii]